MSDAAVRRVPADTQAAISAQLRAFSSGLAVAPTPVMRLASYLGLATCVAAGSYWLVTDGTTGPVAPTAPAIRTAKIPAAVIARVALAEPAPELAEEVTADSEEPIHGLDQITDPAELAMVFDLDGDTYVRLSEDETATSHGTPHLISGDDVTAVIAPVTVGALPPALRGWANRAVVVDGACEARVVGFAEISRVIGFASDPTSYDEDGEPIPADDWTVESVREQGVVLAAKLDRCDGTWARAADWSPAAIVAKVDAPALERVAADDMVAMFDSELADDWREQGGEGTWRDAAKVTTSTWAHPLTEERWIFVQASHPGTCGEANIEKLAAYRVGADGQPRFVSELGGGHDTIEQVIDVDGDGQPELLMASEDDSTELVDLAGSGQQAIYIPHVSYGCGC